MRWPYYLRDTSGRTLGWFDPKSKEVHLLPGADPKVVAHEIMWHGTRDYISQLAAKGDAKAQKFLDMVPNWLDNLVYGDQCKRRQCVVLFRLSQGQELPCHGRQYGGSL